MNDEDKTEQPEPEPDRGAGEPGTEETEEMGSARRVGPSPAPTVDPGRRRFLRSSDDRIIAGVAGGLGNYFEIDPVIIRIAFAVSVLFGGLGVIAYFAAAIFVPSDDGRGAPAASGRGRGVLQVLGIALLVIVAFSGFGALAVVAAFATGLGFGLPVAALVVIIGVALAVLSFRGGAKWLIVPALALTIGVGAAAAADLDLKGGIGDRDYRPQSVSAIPEDGYKLGVGRIAVDLRGIDWSPKQIVDLDLHVGAGQALVAVPADVCVVADAHMGAGLIRVAGLQSDGFDVDLNTGEDAHGLPQLRINADGDVGEIRVVNDDHVPINKLDRVPHEPFESGQVARAANTKACAA
jgi:phage shock protein PspC (stress-responsive transcriptional regulator)